MLIKGQVIIFAIDLPSGNRNRKINSRAQLITAMWTAIDAREKQTLPTPHPLSLLGIFTRRLERPRNYRAILLTRILLTEFYRHLKVI